MERPGSWDDGSFTKVLTADILGVECAACRRMGAGGAGGLHSVSRASERIGVFFRGRRPGRGFGRGVDIGRWLMLIADEERPWPWRVWWFIRYYATYPPRRAYVRLLCATFGCRWYPPTIVDHQSLSTWYVIGHTCERCLRTTCVPVMLADEITGGPKDVA